MRSRVRAPPFGCTRRSCAARLFARTWAFAACRLRMRTLPLAGASRRICAARFFARLRAFAACAPRMRTLPRLMLSSAATSRMHPVSGSRRCAVIYRGLAVQCGSHCTHVPVVWFAPRSIGGVAWCSWSPRRVARPGSWSVGLDTCLVRSLTPRGGRTGHPGLGSTVRCCRLRSSTHGELDSTGGDDEARSGSSLASE